MLTFSPFGPVMFLRAVVILARSPFEPFTVALMTWCGIA
jgi:hypothetical protein